MIRDPQRQRIARRDRFHLAQNFGDVPALCREITRAVRPLRIVAQQMAVLLHRRTASGGVDHNSVDVRPFKELNNAARHYAGLLFQPGMNHQGPAAWLIHRGNDLAPFGGQNARCCCIDVREENLLHASRQHPHPPAMGCSRRCVHGICAAKFEGTTGSRASIAARRFGSEPEQTRPTKQRSAARTLIEKQWGRQHAESRGMRKSREQKFAEERVARAAGNIALHLRARIFDELVVLYAGGASRHARHAAQTVIHVLAEGWIERGVSFGGFLHHVDAAARRIHLFSPQNIRGTCGQAEAAVHAIGQQFLVRRVMRIETGRLCGLDSDKRLARHIPPRKRPGLRVRLGSKRRLISRINVGELSVPHGGTAHSGSGRCGARKTVSEPPPAAPT